MSIPREAGKSPIAYSNMERWKIEVKDIYYKMKFKMQNIKWCKREHCILIKGIIVKEEIMIVNVYGANNKALNSMKTVRTRERLR